MIRIPDSESGGDPASSGGKRRNAFSWIGHGSACVLAPTRDLSSGHGDSASIRARRTLNAPECERFLGTLLATDPGVDRFFAAGGRELWVLPAPFEAANWFAAEGEPGERVGVSALRDLADDVGLVIVTDLSDELHEPFLRFAEREREFFFLLVSGAGLSSGASDDEAIKARVLGPRVVALKGSQAKAAALSLAGSVDVSNAGSWRLGGGLSRRASISGPRVVSDTSDGGESGGGSQGAKSVDRKVEAFFDELRTSDVAEELDRWRLSSGLTRSIDQGSRWVLFEPNHPLVWRRLERETRAFLHELTLEGVVPTWAGGSEVRCRSGDGGDGRLALEVEVPLGDRTWTYQRRAATKDSAAL